jgi:hypothetical protein
MSYVICQSMVRMGSLKGFIDSYPGGEPIWLRIVFTIASTTMR